LCGYFRLVKEAFSNFTVRDKVDFLYYSIGKSTNGN
jgi:hypothetical protein